MVSCIFVIFLIQTQSSWGVGRNSVDLEKTQDLDRTKDHLETEDARAIVDNYIRAAQEGRSVEAFISKDSPALRRKRNAQSMRSNGSLEKFTEVPSNAQITVLTLSTDNIGYEMLASEMPRNIRTLKMEPDPIVATCSSPTRCVVQVDYKSVGQYRPIKQEFIVIKESDGTWRLVGTNFL